MNEDTPKPMPEKASTRRYNPMLWEVNLRWLKPLEMGAGAGSAGIPQERSRKIQNLE